MSRKKHTAPGPKYPRQFESMAATPESGANPHARAAFHSRYGRQVPVPGFRMEQFEVATTLLDAGKAPAKAIAVLLFFAALVSRSYFVERVWW